eukprot:PITA_22369
MSTAPRPTASTVHPAVKRSPSCVKPIEPAFCSPSRPIAARSAYSRHLQTICHRSLLFTHQSLAQDNKQPDIYGFHSFQSLPMSTIIQAEPPTFEKALKEQVWKDAMAKVYESIMKNDVWGVVLRPKGKSVVTLKWLYKIKYGTDGSIEKYIARFVARGFSQKEGEEYDDIFALVA